ncbi:MAG TPA: response regulator transcription factor [Gammaproteobacteria bacterium]|nr:response regulator transcription factor [Gammaproteobacteria bacterium]
MIRILIAEDQSMILGALAAMLDMETDISVVARATNGNDALHLALEEKPDVVVTDIEMPGMSGLEFAAALREKQLAARVIIVTTFARPGYLRRALDAGVKGYLLKDAPAQQLAEAIRTIHRGGKVIAPELATEAWECSDPLNDRERRVLRLAGEGLSSAEIAKQLFLSEGTVRNYLSEAIGKLGAGNRVEAARIARQKGWL